MPDLDTFDLDAAFRGLEQHVADRTTSRGAGLAIDTARRRRRTTVGAIAAVAVLAVGGAVIGQGLGGQDHTVGPTGFPRSSAFDADAFNSAAAGWTSGWTLAASEAFVSLQGLSDACASAFDGIGGGPAPERVGGPDFTSSVYGSAVSRFQQWGPSHPGAASNLYAAAMTELGPCTNGSRMRPYSWEHDPGSDDDNAAVTSYSTPRHDGLSTHIWIATFDNEFGVLLTSGTTRPVPGAVDRRIAAALIAGLQSPATYAQTATSGSSASSSPGGAVPSLSAEVFAHAVSGWDTAWSASSGDRSISEVPCVNAAVWPGTDGGLESTSLGGNGDQEFGTFDSTAHAAAAFGRLRQALTGCDGSSYTLQQPVRGGGLQTFEASGTDVVWAVQQGRHVGVITVPGNGTPPPVSVSVAVVTAIQSAMQGASG